MRKNISSTYSCALFLTSPLWFAMQSVHANQQLDRLQQHYIDKSKLNTTQHSKQLALLEKRPHCEGVWVQPNRTASKSTQPKHTTSKPDASSNDTNVGDTGILAYADRVYFSPDKTGTLTGNVKLTQDNKTIEADEIEIDLTTEHVEVSGNIALTDGDIFSLSEELGYNIKNKQSDINQSAFFSEKRQAHGMAGRIEQKEKGVVRLYDVSYSTCAPRGTAKANNNKDSSTDPKATTNTTGITAAITESEIETKTAVPNTPAHTTEPSRTKKESRTASQSHAKSWELNAKKLKLDDNTGRGYAKDTRLIIMGVPTLYLPYINFPIDDRRMSGLLIPQLGFSNGGGLDFSAPYYFNLAPNYDATLTPRILFSRGVMLEGEFRHLSEDYGTTQVNGGFLPKDSEYTDESGSHQRSHLRATHDWDVSRRLNAYAEYNYVSDEKYFSDLSNNPLVQDELNLPRKLELSYTDDKRELTGSVKVETFQTVAPDLKDADKPYSRLPQLKLNYSKGSPLGFMTNVALDLGYFAKRINDGSAVEDSGTRLYSNVSTEYNYTRSWGYIKPALSLSHLFTVFDDTTIEKQGLSRGENDRETILLPGMTLNTGLVFESIMPIANTQVSQTLEPRLFYSYTPYKDQNNLPNFETTTASLNYDQLFTNKRFLGHDRIANSNALSLGLNYRIFDHKGIERFNLGVGNRFNFTNKQVQLNGDKTTLSKRSGPITRIQGYITPTLQLTSDIAFTERGKHNFHVTQLNWKPEVDTLVNVGYFNRTDNPTTGQQRLNQATASVIAPLSAHWRVMAHAQYDFKLNEERDLLLGATYDSCCYRVSFYGRQYYNNLVDPETTNAKRQFGMEVTLKGLAGLSGSLGNLLETKILGYNRND